MQFARGMCARGPAPVTRALVPGIPTQALKPNGHTNTASSCTGTSWHCHEASFILTQTHVHACFLHCGFWNLQVCLRHKVTYAFVHSALPRLLAFVTQDTVTGMMSYAHSLCRLADTLRLCLQAPEAIQDVSLAICCLKLPMHVNSSHVR